MFLLIYIVHTYLAIRLKFSRAVSGVILTYILINNITKHQETLLLLLSTVWFQERIRA